MPLLDSTSFWSNGVLEWWSDVSGEGSEFPIILNPPISSSFSQYSITPTLHSKYGPCNQIGSP
jgi:hypothetical protein